MLLCILILQYNVLGLKVQALIRHNGNLERLVQIRFQADVQKVQHELGQGNRSERSRPVS